MLLLFLILFSSYSIAAQNLVFTLKGNLERNDQRYFNELPATSELISLMDDRFNQMQVYLQDRIDAAHHQHIADIKILKKNLIESTNEVHQLKRRMNRHENTECKERRLKRSTATDEDDDDESSAARLEISPTHMGSMPYADHRINIYAHSGNNLQVTDSMKRYYYSPICILNHESAKSSFSRATNQSQVRFSIEMWNDDIEQEILRYTTSLLNHPISVKQIQVLPIEEVKLISIIPHNYNYQIGMNNWLKYQQYPRSLSFYFNCSNQVDCDQLAEQMKTNPLQFDFLRLVVRLNSLTSQRREVVIKLENIIKGDLIAKLNQRYPEAQTVILTADDQQTLESESLSNIVVNIFDDFSEEGAIIAPDSEKRVRDILMNLMESSKIDEQMSEAMWDSVFWNDDNYRPDKTAKTMNDIYKKLDDQQQRNLIQTIDEKNKTKGEGFLGFKPLKLGLGVEVDIENERGEKYSQENLTRLIQEAKETVMWEGEKFVPKQMNLSRVNLAKLKNSKVFQERNVKVAYSTTTLSMNVNVKENLGRQFVDEISRVNNRLIDFKESLSRPPDCYEPGKTPSSCQDLQCIGYKLNGFYLIRGHFKMETVYCTFDNQTAETRIGYADIKSLEGQVNFYVQRGRSFSVASDSIIPFQIEVLNIGRAMNLSRGVFEAPRSGIYHFAFTGVKDWDGVGLTIQLVLNGGTPKAVLVGTANGGDREGYSTLALESTLKLAAGDRISLKKIGKGVLKDDSNHYSHFTGRLLEEDLILP